MLSHRLNQAHHTLVRVCAKLLWGRNSALRASLPSLKLALQVRQTPSLQVFDYESCKSSTEKHIRLWSMLHCNDQA
eukprot:2202-Heterococcus_DN1.PRE.3